MILFLFREGSQFVIWNYNNDGINTSLTWYQTTFKTPTLDGKVILLRISGLNRGHIYLNGYDVAHYWTITGSCAVQLGCKLLFFSNQSIWFKFEFGDFLKNYTLIWIRIL